MLAQGRTLNRGNDGAAQIRDGVRATSTRGTRPLYIKAGGGKLEGNDFEIKKRARRARLVSNTLAF
jgi:hypothetical protein